MQDSARQVHFAHASPSCAARLAVRDLGQRLFFGFPTAAAYNKGNKTYAHVKTGEKVCTAEYDYDDIVSYIILHCSVRVRERV